MNGPPPANLLALGLGGARTELPDDEDDLELEPFLCALPDLELHACLGRGGMGRVYRARQIRLDRFVAVKLMNADLGQDPEFRERFEREARALARLDHPGVVRVHEFGEAGGLFYLVMELVEGPNLRDLMAQGVAPDEASRLIGQLCDALAYAHGRGVVHRDIKPENVLIDEQGRVRVADFGLAKLQRKDHQATTRRVVGTPQYMAPEQLTDPGSVDHRADVFAIGVVLYEMLTGQLPVGRFPSPSELGHGDAQLDAVVLRALESNRDKRFQAASEIRVALESRVEDDPATVTYVDKNEAPAPRRRAWMLGGGVAAAAAAAAVTFAVVSSDSPEGETPAAAVPPEVAAAEAGPQPPSTEDAAAPSGATPDASPTINRWPMSDLAVLAPDTIAVIGVDWSDLRHAPALARLAGAFGGGEASKACVTAVLDRTDKVIVTLDANADVTEVYAHADWSPEDLKPCVEAAARDEAGEDAAKVRIEQAALGEFTRYHVEGLEQPPIRPLVAMRDGTRLILSFRKDLTLDGATALFSGDGPRLDLSARALERIDTDAPVWFLAGPIPEDWDDSIAEGWGQLDIWEKLEVDATIVYNTEESAQDAAAVLLSYKTIFSKMDDAPKMDATIRADERRVSVKGWVELPEDIDAGGSIVFGANPKGGLSFNISNRGKSKPEPEPKKAP